MHVSQPELQVLSKPCPHSQSWLSDGTLPNSFYETNINYPDMLTRVQLFATPWTVAHQLPLSMEFPRQEYWSGLSFLPLEYLPDPGIKPGSLTLQADSLQSVPPGKPPVQLKTS